MLQTDRPAAGGRHLTTLNEPGPTGSDSYRLPLIIKYESQVNALNTDLVTLVNSLSAIKVAALSVEPLCFILSYTLMDYIGQPRCNTSFLSRVIAL